MALSTTAIDLNRATSGVTLPLQLAQEVWARTIDSSFVLSMANRIDLPGSGLSIPIITSDPQPDWVGAETYEKAVSTPGISSKTMTPYTLAVIVPMSKQFARDMDGLYAELVRRLPAVLGAKIDATILGGNAPGTGFDVLSSAPSIGIADKTYQALVNAQGRVAAQGGELTMWAMSPAGRVAAMRAVDTSGRPIFMDAAGPMPATMAGVGTMVNKNAFVSGSPNVLGIGGDWSKAHVGIVQGITIDYSDQATINDGTNNINLWQRNMFALRVECEVGFVVEDDDYFVRLTEAKPAPVTDVTTLSVVAGATGDIVVTESYGTLTAASSATGKATVAVSGNVVTVTGVAAGNATVTITDAGTGATTTVAVTVTAAS